MPVRGLNVSPKKIGAGLAWGVSMWGLIASASAAQPPASTAKAPAPSGSVAAMVGKYCIDCHSEDTHKGDFSLEELDAKNPQANAEAWEKVIRKLRHRQMPPEDEPRPDEATYNAIVTQLESTLDRAAVQKPQPGTTDTFRRLTRTEYQNSIRDLLGLEVDAAALLPKDDSALGFDNITVSELSPTLLERYLGAAKKIGALALGRPVSGPQSETVQVPIDLTQEGGFEGLPPGTRGGATAKFYMPLDAEYEIQLRLSRDRNDQVEGLKKPQQIDLLVDGEPVHRFEVAVPPPRTPHHQVDRHLVLRLPVKAGPHEIAATFVPTGTVVVEQERAPTLARFNMDRHPRLQPALYSIAVVGPYNPTGPGDTPARRRIFTKYPKTAAEEDACAKEIIATLTRRAFRRPVTAEDIAGPWKFYAATKATEGFEAGIEMALRAVLLSPNFLFRVESPPASVAHGAVYRVPDVQLASRLSFFLWSSIPDDELLALAEKEKLRDPAVLAAQVKRMLRDPRSESLVNSFAAQWLHLRNVDLARPDPRQFRDFDDNLRSSMRRETELFIDSILREDRSALDLLRADYTFLNERLARHYEIPFIYGSEFRRVDLAGTGRGGGLLNHASILTVTSHVDRTSPVVRGNWILGNILGTPPKPPPPDVPQLKERAPGGAILSMREQVAAHRANPACASCHNMMDPLGFALENYDAVGRWRDNDNGAAIVSTGRLPDGTPFHNAQDLQAAILRRPELFVGTLVEKLMLYSLGRGLQAYDAPAVRKIVTQAAASDYRFSALVVGIVQSTPFQMRTAP